jgi:hypothetical protein
MKAKLLLSYGRILMVNDCAVKITAILIFVDLHKPESKNKQIIVVGIVVFSKALKEL